MNKTKARIGGGWLIGRLLFRGNQQMRFRPAFVQGYVERKTRMRNTMNRVRHLAILTVGMASLMGWINTSGKNVYAQYYCSLTCGASVPGTGKTGTAVALTASASTYYCQGDPTYSWDFGDGASGSGPSTTHTYNTAGSFTWMVSVTIDDTSNSVSGTIVISAATNPVKGVSAASYDGSALTSEAIVAAFGSNLATTTQVATSVPLPTTLAGTTVKVKDSAGTERLAPLFFVSPGQINHQVPAGTAAGTATVTVTSGDGTVSVGTAQIVAVAPGLFSANASGLGVPAGYLLRFSADNSQSTEAISQFDAGQNKFIPVPIDLGAEGDQLFLVLFGTGIRFRSSLSGVAAQIGGMEAQVLFAGPQGDFVGLDQLNLQVPKSLAGRGEVDLVLTVDGKIANTVRVSIK